MGGSRNSRKSNRPSVVLINLRWLAPGELEYYEKPFGKEINLMDIEQPKAISEKSVKGDNKIGWRKYGGFLFAIMAAICFSLTSLSSKLLARKKYHTFSIALWKYQGMTIIGPILLIYFRFFKKQNIFESIWPLTKPKSLKTVLLLVARASVGFCSILLQVQSLRYLKLADSTVISFSTPIAVVLFARIFLSEKCGIVPILTAFVTLAGVGILTRPPLLTGQETFDENILIGTAYAFSCMLFLTMVFIIVRSLREVHFSLLLFFYGYLATIESVILLASIGIIEIPQSDEDWVIVGGNAIFSVLGQFCITLALKYEQAGPVSLVRTLDIVFSFIWQFIFLSVYPDEFSLIGAVIIMFGISLTAFRKWLTTLPVGHKAKQRFWLILK